MFYLAKTSRYFAISLNLFAAQWKPQKWEHQKLVVINTHKNSVEHVFRSAFSRLVEPVVLTFPNQKRNYHNSSHWKQPGGPSRQLFFFVRMKLSCTNRVCGGGVGGGSGAGAGGGVREWVDKIWVDANKNAWTGRAQMNHVHLITSPCVWQNVFWVLHDGAWENNGPPWVRRLALSVPAQIGSSLFVQTNTASADYEKFKSIFENRITGGHFVRLSWNWWNR